MLVTYTRCPACGGKDDCDLIEQGPYRHYKCRNPDCFFEKKQFIGFK